LGRRLSRANRNIKWIETHCRVPDGKDIGKQVKLRAWQKRDLRKIYDNPAGTRTAIITFGKKNGKTSLAACLVLLHLCGPEHVPNSQIPSTAQSRDQAAILFNLAAKMVRLEPKLDDVITIRESVKQLVCPELGTTYRALSADASTSHGQSPAFAVHDELGQEKGPVSELYNSIDNAMGAHANPLAIIISTQAPTDGALLSRLIDHAKSGKDPTIVLSMYTADEKMDPFSDEALKAANPAAGDFLNMEELRKQAKNAKAIPSQETLYRNYTLNQRVDRNTPFISRSLWKENGGYPSKFGDLPVFAGLDLSKVNDLTAFVPMAWNEDAWDVRPTFWLPGENIREKSRQDRVEYDYWAEEGYLELTPGRAVEYEFVAGYLFKFFQRYNVQKIAFDRWNMSHFRPWLLKAGFTEELLEEHFVDFGQGFQSMSPALRDLESALLSNKVRHGNHPVLAMCAANAVVTTDPAGGRKLDKTKAAGRIDGMVALTMAFGVAPTDPPQSVDDWLEAAAA
jgi:phage terminase large subunit-like protein